MGEAGGFFRIFDDRGILGWSPFIPGIAVSLVAPFSVEVGQNDTQKLSKLSPWKRTAYKNISWNFCHKYIKFILQTRPKNFSFPVANES